MIADDKEYPVVHFLGDTQSLEEVSANIHTSFAVSLGSLILAQVMHEEDEIEKAGNLVLAQNLKIAHRRVVLALKNLVEDVDAVKNVYVRGEAMVKVVLNLTGQPSEFRNESSEHAEFMHLAQGRTHVPDFLHDRAEGDVCGT